MVATSPLFLRDAIVTLDDHGKVDVLGLSDRGVSRVAELELSSEAASTRMLPAGDGFVEISRDERQIRLHLPATRPGVKGGEH